MTSKSEQTKAGLARRRERRALAIVPRPRYLTADQRRSLERLRITPGATLEVQAGQYGGFDQANIIIPLPRGRIRVAHCSYNTAQVLIATGKLERVSGHAKAHIPLLAKLARRAQERRLPRDKRTPTPIIAPDG